jgi:trehalose-6-phosphate synthase
MAALRIIIEHSLEWNSSSFLKFVDFEKTFDNLDREVLWNLMAHYGIPQKFINIIRNSYNNMQCRVIHDFVPLEMFLALHIFPRMLKMTLALLILFFTSASMPSSIFTMLPR